MELLEKYSKTNEKTRAPYREVLSDFEQVTREYISQWLDMDTSIIRTQQRFVVDIPGEVYLRLMEEGRLEDYVRERIAREAPNIDIRQISIREASSISEFREQVTVRIECEIYV